MEQAAWKRENRKKIKKNTTDKNILHDCTTNSDRKDNLDNDFSTETSS